MMTDLEATRLCAKAMGYRTDNAKEHGRALYWTDSAEHVIDEFDPLYDDAQAMALVKAFKLTIDHFVDGDFVVTDNDVSGISIEGSDLNRAIVECVAKMQRISAPPQ